MNNKIDFLRVYDEDLINTKSNIDEYVRYLYGGNVRVTNAICGSWGSGKSYFINQLNAIIDENSDKDKNYRGILDETKIDKRAKSFIFNASEYDFYDEPFTAFLFWFIGECNKDIKVLEESRFSNLLSFVTKIVGHEIDLKKLKGEQINLIKDALELEKVKIQIMNLFKELVAETSDRIVIFIDELDRCEPQFAVKLIERLKHFIIDDRFVFVYSIDIDNLSSIVKGFYGETYDAGNYFEKIIDFKYFLNKKDNALEYFISKKFDTDKSLLYDGLKILINDFGVTIRELDKVLPTLENILVSSRDSKRTNFFKILIVPLLKVIRIKNPIVYQNVINKKDLTLLGDHISKEYNKYCIEYIQSMIEHKIILDKWLYSIMQRELESGKMNKVYEYYTNEIG